MNIFLSISLIIVIFSDVTDSRVVIDKHDDNCKLEPNLVEEIASYRTTARKIMNEIIENGYGREMYDQYTDFIDRFGARPSGTENLEKAIDHMVNLTINNGLNDVTNEKVGIPTGDIERVINLYYCKLLYVPHWVRGHESAKMIEPYEKKIQILGFGTSVGTPLGGIVAEAIVIRSFEELEKTDEARIRGKIVVFDAHYISYGETVIYRSEGASKAAKKGAVATLVRSITPFSIYSPHTGAQYYNDNDTKIPTAAITLEDADLLRRIQDSKSVKQKIVIHIKMNNTFDTKESRNTIVDLKGKEHPEKLVIVSGHIDSWDVGTGAMDDGGGMMISWFVPVILNKLNLKPKRTVRAILWTAEEPGLIGAEAYLKKHIEDLDNINFIMESDEGTFKPLGLDVAGTNKTRCIIAEVLKLFSPLDKITNSGSPGSDIILFIEKGVPGASLLNENERYYWFHHSEGDTLNVQNMPDVIECAAFWAAFSYVIADLSTDIPRT